MNENDWLKEFFTDESESPDLQNIENVKNFALMWNLFERYFCDRNANLNIIKAKLTDIVERGYTLPTKVFDAHYDYFNNRYITNNLTNQFFESLNFRDNNSDLSYKNYLKQNLEEGTPVDYDKIFALFIISYRFRNNLFHGSKQIATISKQNESFKHINEVLMKFLNFLKNSGKLSEEKLN